MSLNSIPFHLHRGYPPPVGLPGPLLPPAPAPPLPVVSLPLLAQHYQLAAPPALQLVQPLAPQLVLHPPLLFRPPLRHTVVKSSVKAKVLGAPCVVKSPAVKAVAATSEVKAPPTVKLSGGAPEVNKNSVVALGSSRRKSEEKHEAIVKRESGSKRETNGTVPEEITRQIEKCGKSSTEAETPSGDISSTACSDVASIKVRKMKHVMVVDEDRKLFTELPLEPDDTLALKLLQRHFPGVCGLTYRSPDCSHRQWIVLEGGKLRAPKGGWGHDPYVCVFSEQSGGKWLHTFCHCSFSKPSKNKQAKSPVKSLSSRNSPVKNRASVVSSKNSRSAEPEVYVVEDGRESERRRCAEMAVCSLPQWVTDEQLREHFGQYGRVVTCVVRKDLVGARYGLVKFRHSSSREKALAEVFHRFGDTWCSVRSHS